MAKNVVFLILLGLVSCDRSGDLPTTPISSNASAGLIVTPAAIIPEAMTMTTREKVVKFYTGEVGVREMTGKNDGKRVEEYLKTVGLGKGYAWCAAYVKFVYMSCEVPEANKINGMALSLHVPAKAIYFKGVQKEEPRAGDVFTLWYNNLGRIGHTGFYAGPANKKMGTFFSNEGNTDGTGGREGDGVYRRIRQISGVYSINKWIKD